MMQLNHMAIGISFLYNIGKVCLGRKIYAILTIRIICFVRKVMMTNLLKKIYELENILKNDSDKVIVEKIKQDIAYLKWYTWAFVEYKFLLGLKRNLIPANKVTETDVSPFNKWMCLLYYKEKNNGKSKQEYFHDLPSDHTVTGYGNWDNSILTDSLANLLKFLYTKKEPRYTEIFPNERMSEIEKSILRYFLYKNGKLRLVDEDTFLEDYFSQSEFILPLEKYFSDVLQKGEINNGELRNLWMRFFASPRVYLFSKNHNIKKVTGYNKNPIFKGKSEYNYFDLKEKIDNLNLELRKELSDVFESNWIKSKMLDILCSSNLDQFVDISLELKLEYLKVTSQK